MSLKRQFTQDITYVSKDTVVSQNDSGDPIYSETKVTLKGRHDRHVERIIDPEGNERDSRHKIVTEAEIPMDSQVWLPGDDITEDAKFRPLATFAATSFRGESIYETWL